MVVRHCDGHVTVERLGVGGTPPGLLPVAQYEEGSTVLEKSDILVCFSDGISEACNSRDELWDESEVENLLRTASGATAREVTERVVQAADAFTGDAEQADDMTIVTLRVVYARRQLFRIPISATLLGISTKATKPLPLSSTAPRGIKVTPFRPSA